MSRFQEEYMNAESLDIIIWRAQYAFLMNSKRDIENMGADMLSKYRAKRRAA